MERQTFVLTLKKTFRHTIKIFLKNGDKTYLRPAKFTTEHKVSERERTKNARAIAAEFSTSDEALIDGLYRDSGYGKTFVHIDDPKGERKRLAFDKTPLDSKKLALRNLFEAVNLTFDNKKEVDVLTEEYNIHVSATSGKTIAKGNATVIPHEPIDVQQQLSDTAEMARKIYEERYGESIPVEYANDLGFLSGLSNPDWDAKGFIEKQEKGNEEQAPVDEGKKLGLPNTPEELWPIYFEAFGTNVANPKKNDIAWMQAKIQEKRNS